MIKLRPHYKRVYFSFQRRFGNFLFRKKNPASQNGTEYSRILWLLSRTAIPAAAKRKPNQKRKKLALNILPHNSANFFLFNSSPRYVPTPAMLQRRKGMKIIFGLAVLHMKYTSRTETVIAVISLRRIKPFRISVPPSSGNLSLCYFTVYHTLLPVSIAERTPLNLCRQR